MATPKIVRTVVTPGGDHAAVEIQVLDALLPDGTLESSITLSVRVGLLESPLLAEIEYEAISKTIELLQTVKKQCEATIKKSNRTPGAPRPAV